MRKPRSPRPKPEIDNSSSPGVEIIPPGENPSNNGLPNIYADIAAQINQYTDRPDLLMETLEKHDPGFIKKMNEEAREYAKKSRNSRFHFGRTQAYASLALQIVAAGAVLYILYVLAMKEVVSFWLIAGLAIFYAISQAGTAGFMRVIDQLHKIFSGSKR